MKYLLIFLLLLIGCKKQTKHVGIVVGHEWSPAYQLPMITIGPNNTLNTTYIYYPEVYSLKVLERDTIHTTEVEPQFYSKINNGDSISYMR